MENKKNNSTGGMGFASALQVAFIVLKLCKVIDWPWIWVLAPTWVSLALVVIVAAIVTVGDIWRRRR